MSLASLDEYPKEFTCPITTKCMIDPVTAANGITYERSAIQEWLSKERTSQSSKLRGHHFNLAPNHEKKSQIAAWRISEQQKRRKPARTEPPSSQQLEQQLKSQFMQITWSNSAAQVLDEITSLAKLVTENALCIPQSQLGRLRGSLQADAKVWSTQVGAALLALESQCEAIAESLLERMEAAKVTGQRATHIKQTSVTQM